MVINPYFKIKVTSYKYDNEYDNIKEIYINKLDNFFSENYKTQIPNFSEFMSFIRRIISAITIITNNKNIKVYALINNETFHHQFVIESMGDYKIKTLLFNTPGIALSSRTIGSSTPFPILGWTLYDMEYKGLFFEDELYILPGQMIIDYSNIKLFKESNSHRLRVPTFYNKPLDKYILLPTYYKRP